MSIRDGNGAVGHGSLSLTHDDEITAKQLAIFCS